MDWWSFHFKVVLLPCLPPSGFFTAKGKLVSSILNPQPENFRYYSDSFKFLLMLGAVGKNLTD